MRSLLLSQGFIWLNFETFHGRRLNRLSGQLSPIAWLTPCWKTPYRHRPFWLHLLSLILPPHNTVKSLASLSWKTPHRCWKGPPKPPLFQAQQQARFLHLPSECKKAHASRQLGNSSLISPFPCPGGSTTDAVFWMWSNKCQVEGDNQLTYWLCSC